MPWNDKRLGAYSEECKEKILNLSYVEDTFKLDPPEGEFPNFDLSEVVDMAVKLCENDPNLTHMQMKLIRPHGLQEYPFWRNYFYRVNLIVQAYIEKTEESNRIVSTGSIFYDLIIVPDNIPIKTLTKEKIELTEKNLVNDDFSDIDDDELNELLKDVDSNDDDDGIII